MEFVVNTAVEEICSQGSDGLTLQDLWPKLKPSLFKHGLDLCPYVKAALWSKLLNIHGLQFEAQGVLYYPKDDSQAVKSVEKCEQMNLKIVASDPLRRNFLGIYDFPFTQPQRRTLERLAVARTDGITQSALTKEFGMRANNFFHVLRNLESNGLIVRQPTVMRTKKACSEGDSGNSAVSTTNMLHLGRYARHLGCQQRLEVVKEDNVIAARNSGSGIGSIEESSKEDVHVKDYLPALKAVCDKLEQAQRNVLVVSDIKQDLGYQGVPGHRAWRNICHRLKEAQVVEEFRAEVDKKEVTCMRLLKKFSPKHFEPKSVGGKYDDLDADEPMQFGKRGQITDQLVELPIMHQAYDMIHTERGLASHEVCKRLGIRNKWYKGRIQNMLKIHLQAESSNDRGPFQSWTYGNRGTGAPNTVPSKLESVLNGSNKCDPPIVDLEADRNLVQSIEEVDFAHPKDDFRSSDDRSVEPEISNGSRADGEGNNVLHSVKSSDNYAFNTSGEDPDIKMKIVSTTVLHPSSLELSSPAISTLSRCQSHQRYHYLTLGAASLREQHILKILEEEKFLIKPELHRRLENLEKEKNKMMCRKTLERILNKLQLEGQCKCISISVPATTNLGRSRTTQVVLHPSVCNVDPEVLGQIYERLRCFEMQVRRQCYSQLKKGESLTVLDGIERTSNNVKLDNHSEYAEARRANGYVLGKMVRAKLLHIFLWNHLSSLPGWDNGILFGKHGHDMKNSHITCGTFEAYAAIKTMPLKLFLQVVGTTQELENLTEKCRSGLCLSDLPLKEYKGLMDARAMRNLSRLIDILRRLKLLCVVSVGHTDEVDKVQHTNLTYALELKPYIEEPVSIVSSPSGFFFPDHRPRIRHDFVLLTRKAVDEYWSSLEYCYAAANSKAALRAFPGSVVHEVFFSRSWASDQVMLADQCAELVKHVINDDPHKKLSMEECKKIANDLNMTVGQVLHVFNQKKQPHLIRLPRDSYDKGEEVLQLRSTHVPASCKRKRSSEGKFSKHVKAATEDSQSNEERLAQISVTADQFTEKGNSLLATSEAYECDLHHDHIHDQTGPVEEQESHEEDEDSFIDNSTLSRLKPRRQRKFSWTEAADRQLVIEYIRHRAALGAKYYRTNWGSLSNLPAPPDTCRRRMALLKGSTQFKNSVSKLCNMLAKRYVKYLEKFQNLSNQADRKVMVREHMTGGDSYQKFSNSFDCNIEFLSEERWDNFDDSNIKMALDDVLRHKMTAKVDSLKRGYSDVQTDGCDPFHSKMDSSTPLSERREKCSRRSKFAAQRSISCHFPQKYSKLLNKGKSVSRRVYESIAVSNAVELFKLIFLSTSAAPQASVVPAETLRCYSKGDLFAAFSYLREKKAIIGGSGTSPFGLSLLFLRSMSLSPFPTNTGKRASRFASWLDEREKALMEEEIDLPGDLQCGDIFHLCALVSKGELSVIPYLPDEGVGEAEDLRISKRKNGVSQFTDIDKSKRMRTSRVDKSEIISRREKGFPGIRLSLSRGTIPIIHALKSSKDEDSYVGKLFWEKSQDNTVDLRVGRTSSRFHECDLAKEILDSGTIVQTAEAVDKSPWEAMASYAGHLFSSCSDEKGSAPFHPKLFETICSAIQKSGDEGLSMNEISTVLNVPGDTVSEIVVDVLERFGRALKVQAFDSTQVVDSVYQTKYILTSKAGIDQNPNRTRSVNCEGKSGNENLQNQEIDFIPTQNVRNMDTDEVHRVSILNHPVEVGEPLSKIRSTHQIEDQGHPELIPGKCNPIDEMFELHSGDSTISRHILPWINGDGTTNKIVYKGLTRRLLGIVMQHPGLLEDDIIKQMHALNPQSCRKLMETMILDKHIIVRKMHESTSAEPPAILSGLLQSSIKKSTIVYREHFFANPMSTNLL